MISVAIACILTGCTFVEERVIPQKFEIPDVDAVIEVNADTVMEKNFLGVGAQWSSYPWWDISDADWEKLFRRVEYMKLPFVRVMIDAFWYCQGFDDSGKPIYTWDTSYMKKLYKLLDWCEANNAVVMFGEWGKPEGKDLALKTEDPVWTKIIGDCMVYLLDEKGYTCIKYYNLINEPHGWWTYITFDQWKTAINNLHTEFVKRGIRDQVMIASPDASRWCWSRAGPVTRAPRQLPVTPGLWPATPASSTASASNSARYRHPPWRRPSSGRQRWPPSRCPRAGVP